MTSAKKCWSCDERTTYNRGWCKSCQDLIPFDVQTCLTMVETEPFAGMVRLVIAEHIAVMRKKLERSNERLKEYSERTKGRSIPNLDDIDI